MKIKRFRRSILIALIVFLNFVCDLISKNNARIRINDNEIIHVLKDYVIFKKVENAGAAMGFGANLPTVIKTIYFQILPIVFLLYLFRMILLKTQISKLAVIGLAFTIGGGFGNIYDRVLYGSVTDFIVLKIGVLKTGIFNIADVSIIIGIILVFYELLFNREHNIEAGL